MTSSWRMRTALLEALHVTGEVHIVGDQSVMGIMHAGSVSIKFQSVIFANDSPLSKKAAAEWRKAMWATILDRNHGSIFVPIQKDWIAQ